MKFENILRARVWLKVKCDEGEEIDAETLVIFSIRNRNDLKDFNLL